MRVPLRGMALPALRRRLDLRRLLLGDLRLKAAAIMVALVLGVVVERALPAEVTVAFDGRVPVERAEVPEGYVLRGQLGEVSVRLRGPGDAIAALGQQHLRAIIDIDGLRPGPATQDAPIRVTVADESVRVVEVTPAAVAVRLERWTERVIAVQARFANEPPAGFQAVAVTFRPQEVTVGGPESLVAEVAAVFATLRFGDTPVDLAQSVQPIPVDEAGVRIDDVQVDPVAVQASVPVLSTATTRTVPVLWLLRGAVAPGYWISSVATDPVAVTVSGDRAAVAGLDRVQTAEVDVSGLTSGRTFSVPLQIPEGLSLVGGAEAQVTVTVVALTGTRPFPLVAVRVDGLGTGLTAQAEPGTVSVILSGPVPLLVGLGGAAVVASVDASGRGPGTHVLDVAVAVPAGTVIGSVLPIRVTVTISEATE